MAQEKKEPSRRDFIKTLAGLGLGAAMAQTLYSSLNPKLRAQLVAWAQTFGKPMTYAELDRPIDAAACDDVVRAVRYQPYSYIIYQAPDGSYQAKNGNTGQVEFSGTDAASVIQQAINALPNGGRIYLKNGDYYIYDTITIPKIGKGIVIEGEMGYGKGSDTPQALPANTTLHINIPGTNRAGIAIDYISDSRSLFGLMFRDIKFINEGDKIIDAIRLVNTDTAVIDRCTFLNFYRSIVSDYNGSTFPVGEQPGKLWVSACEFASGQYSYIELIRNTQVFIYDNFFESYGPFLYHIYLRDSNKVYIHNNEFNKSTNPNQQACIVIESDTSDPAYIPQGIEIRDNWAKRAQPNTAFIKTVGTGYPIYAVTSQGNYIMHEYNPDENTDPGPYNIGDPANHQVMADDYVTPFTEQFSKLKDHTTDWTANTFRQNKWHPMTVILTFQAADPNDMVVIHLGATPSLAFAVTSAIAQTANERLAITFRVPTLFWWKWVPTGSPSLIGLIAIYE